MLLKAADGRPTHLVHTPRPMYLGHDYTRPGLREGVGLFIMQPLREEVDNRPACCG
jgi:hypothetical protein